MHILECAKLIDWNGCGIGWNVGTFGAKYIRPALRHDFQFPPNNREYRFVHGNMFCSLENSRVDWISHTFTDASSHERQGERDEREKQFILVRSNRFIYSCIEWTSSVLLRLQCNREKTKLKHQRTSWYAVVMQCFSLHIDVMFSINNKIHPSAFYTILNFLLLLSNTHYQFRCITNA